MKFKCQGLHFEGVKKKKDSDKLTRDNHRLLPIKNNEREYNINKSQNKHELRIKGG